MKKILFISLILTVSFLSSFGQVRTVSVQNYQGLPVKGEKPNPEYVTQTYTGVGADVMVDNTDTLQVPFLVNKPFGAKYYANIVLDTIAGADTTCTVNVYGKMFSSQSYSLIETTTTSAISAQVATAIESMTDPTYSMTYAAAVDTFKADSTIINVARTVTVTPVITPYYRYLLFEITPVGDDATGSGVKLDKIELFIPEVFN